MGRLIIDDTTIYELDEECMKLKEQEKMLADRVKETEAKDRTFAKDRVKERPAP